MGFLDSLFGKKEKFRQIPTLSEGQQGFQNEALKRMMGLLGPGGGLDTSAMEQQARGNFMSKTVPGIAEMFTNMGSGGQSSSAFQGALGEAGAGLEQNISAMKPQMNMQLLQALMGPGMQSSFDTGYTPATEGLFQKYSPAAAMFGIGQGAQHGVFGRGMMNTYKGLDAKGKALPEGQMGMSNLMQMLPMLMML